MRRWLTLRTLALLTLPLALLPSRVGATEIWSGRTFTFTRAANVDYTLAQNQDRITPLVWITRPGTQGIFNIHSEAGYTQSVSPAGTEWATGDAVNHASLTFKPWQQWCGSNPPASVGTNAVLHLIAEDIFIDIRFDSWGVMSAGGGAFSYTRAVAPPVPVSSTTWARLKNLYH
jgi:hypothetical protein